MVSQLGGVVNATPFVITLPIYALLFTLEIVIFCHYFIKSRTARISKLFKNYTLILITILLITLSLELWSILVDFSSSFPLQTGYCFGEMYVRILSFILLESTMFLFWIVRVQFIFKTSVLALSNKLIYTIFICIPSMLFVLMIILAVFMIPSYYLVNTSSSNSSIFNGYGCIVAINDANNIIVKIVMIIGQIIAFTLNILYGWFFYHKLKQFQFTCATAIKSISREGRSNAIDILMQKHTLLALISSISAIFAYSIFNILIWTASTSSDSISALQYGFLFIDIDIVIKSVTMLLMFRLYTRQFFKCCWCCIRISAIDYTSCCNCCTVLDREDFNKQVSIFDALDKQASVFSDNEEEIEIIYEDDRYDIDSGKYCGITLDEELGTEFYDITPIHYKYFCLLVKVCIVKGRNKTDLDDNKYRILQYALDGEVIEDEESIFRQIARHKTKKQVVTRRKNSERIDGTFIDLNKKHSNVSKYNFFFRKSQCKYPFIIALKCDSSQKNGDFMARYVQERIEMNINEKRKIESFKYEPLLNEIVNELTTKKLDKNVLYKRVIVNDK